MTSLSSRGSPEPTERQALAAHVVSTLELCDERDALRKRLAEAEREIARWKELAIRAVGDHWAPNDCYSTGPLHGDIRDEMCPACDVIKAAGIAKPAVVCSFCNDTGKVIAQPGDVEMPCPFTSRHAPRAGEQHGS